VVTLALAGATPASASAPLGDSSLHPRAVAPGALGTSGFAIAGPQGARMRVDFLRHGETIASTGGLTLSGDDARDDARYLWTCVESGGHVAMLVELTPGGAVRRAMIPFVVPAEPCAARLGLQVAGARPLRPGSRPRLRIVDNWHDGDPPLMVEVCFRPPGRASSCARTRVWRARSLVAPAPRRTGTYRVTVRSLSERAIRPLARSFAVRRR
jgi:hypothetical protein